MLLLQATPPHRVEDVDELQVHVAGAELSACASLVSLGGRAALLSRVGDDPMGRRVVAAAMRLGVSTDLVAIDPHRPTGVFFRSTPPDGTRDVTYLRRGSAASALGLQDVPRAIQAKPRAVLVSGVTAALGPGPRDAVRELVQRCNSRQDGPAVVLDVNLRPALGDLEYVVHLLRDLLPLVDLLVVGDDESEELLGSQNPSQIMAAAAHAGVGEVVVKGGERGCWTAGAGGSGAQHQQSLAEDVVDPIGAGDAFLGGYLAGRMVGASPGRSAWLGSRMAARVAASPGDTAGLPTAREGASLLADARHSS